MHILPHLLKLHPSVHYYLHTAILPLQLDTVTEPMRFTSSEHGIEKSELSVIHEYRLQVECHSNSTWLDLCEILRVVS